MESVSLHLLVVSANSVKYGRILSTTQGIAFNTFGNIASISTPIVIGYIINATGSFEWALIYVAANAAVAVFSYLVIVGRIERVVLKNFDSNEPGRV